MTLRLRHRLAALSCAAGLALSLAACTGDDGGSGSGTYSFTGATKVGSLIPKADRKPAPAIDAKLLDGKATTLAARKGTVVVLPFWASWCGPCRVEMPSLQSVETKLEKQGVQLLGVNSQDDRGAAESFLKGNRISFPSIFDSQGEVALSLGNIPGKLPFTVIVDRTGKVAAVYFGRYSTVDLDRALTKLRAES